jgi:uncharacterized protein YciI
MIFAVVRARSGAWDFARPMEEQPGWPEHAEFMDRHHERGHVLLAGPLGQDDRKVLIIVRADSGEEVEQLLAGDIWTKTGLLDTVSIEPWRLRIGSLA